jgi:hypothetical protein
MNDLLWLVNYPLWDNVTGIPTSQNPDTPEGLESRLYIKIHRILAELSNLIELELGKLCRSQMDSGRASTLELLQGLPTSREVFRPSEPRLSLSLSTLQEWTWEHYRGLNLTFFTPSIGRSRRVFIRGLSRCLGRSLGSRGPLVRTTGHLTWLGGQVLWRTAFLTLDTLLTDLSWHVLKTDFKKTPNPSQPAKGVGPVGPTLAQLGPGFVPHLSLVSYCWWLPPVLDIMKICMDFDPYDAFPSSNVPEMVNQQNSWNSLAISTYLLYLEWNVGMLAVNICILWPPTLG